MSAKFYPAKLGASIFNAVTTPMPLYVLLAPVDSANALSESNKGQEKPVVFLVALCQVMALLFVLTF